MVTEDEFVSAVSSALNREIDIPFIGEEAESGIFESVVETIAPLIPVDVRGYIVSVSDGMDDEELEEYSEMILDSVVDVSVSSVPLFLRSFVEGYARESLRPIVDSLMKYAQEGLSIFEPKK